MAERSTYPTLVGGPHEGAPVPNLPPNARDHTVRAGNTTIVYTRQLMPGPYAARPIIAVWAIAGCSFEYIAHHVWAGLTEGLAR